MSDSIRKRETADTWAIETDFSRLDRTTFCGFVYDPEALARKFTVEFLVDGVVVETCHGDQPVAALMEKQIADGCFGFSFCVPDCVIDNAASVEARLANLNLPVGKPIHCDHVYSSGAPAQIGELRWLGGLRFGGWLGLEDTEGAIDILVGNQRVMQIAPSGWSHAELGGSVRPARQLDFHLPDHFADGCVRSLSASTRDGRSITPHPISFVAFESGLEAALARLGKWESEKFRGKLFDQLVPASLPFSAYEQWKSRFPLDAPTPTTLQSAVIIVGDGRIEETIDSLEAQTHPHWTAISLPGKHGVTRFDRGAALDFMQGDAGGCDFVVFCLSGAVFYETALLRIAEVFSRNGACECLYGDIDILMSDRSVVPLALPAFDLERTLEQGYAAHLFAMRRQTALDSLASSDTLYRVFNFSLDGEEARSAIIHLPGALGALPQFDAVGATRELVEATSSQLERSGVRAKVEAGRPGLFPAVRVRRAASRHDRTTIVIPTRNRVKLLKACVDSIKPAIGRCHAEILIVDNDSSDPETLQYLSEAPSNGVEVISAEGPFNFSRINNIAAHHSGAANLCLLNNDIEATDDEWLAEMLGRLSDPGVGAVGAKLIWPSGIIQHGGVVLGMNFAAVHAFNDRVEADPGYGDLLKVAHECSAVTAACLLMRREDYLSVGGMDEIRFPVNFNDVDLCLKLRERGRRIVFTPHARLLHLESASRGKDEAADHKARFNRELQMLRSAWGQQLIEDPYYNPSLALDSTPYSALAWPPRPRQPRTNLRPTRSLIPVGL